MPILDNTLIQCDFCEFTFYRECAWCCTPKHVALNMKAQVAMRKPQPQLWACVKCVLKNPEVKKKYGGKFYFDVKWLKQREEPELKCEDCEEWIADYLKEAFAIAEGTQETRPPTAAVAPTTMTSGAAASSSGDGGGAAVAPPPGFTHNELMEEIKELKKTQQDIKRRQARTYREKTWGSVELYREKEEKPAVDENGFLKFEIDTPPGAASAGDEEFEDLATMMKEYGPFRQVNKFG